MNRRQFLTAAAAFAAPAFVRGRVRGAPAPSDRIALGFIGTGGHGTGYNLKSFLQQKDCVAVAVCDASYKRRSIARQVVHKHYGNADCIDYADFREVLSLDDVDAAVISTPDHWHVPMSIFAATAGKDVFCEKPTLTIGEGRILVDVIRRHGRVYQGGIEDRSVSQYHRMAELARNGVLGKLERMHITLPAGAAFRMEQPAPAPDGFDYDMWLGPAPYAPYTPSRCGPQQWRNNLDYSGGKLADWGAHLIDTAQIANFAERSGPVEVDGKGTFDPTSMSTAPIRYKIGYRYANGVEMLVESGGTGMKLYGSDGWVGNGGWRRPLEASSPDILKAKIEPHANKMWPRKVSEHRDFLDGVRSRREPYYTPEAIHRLSTVMHMANISMVLGRKLKWDPEQEEFLNDPDANKMRSRAMREPWNLNAVAL